MAFPPMPGDSGPLKAEASIQCYTQHGRRIGQGGQGTVYVYKYPPTGDIYAAKVLYYDEGDYNNRFIEREQTVAPRFEHAHLMKAHEVFEYAEGLVIVMPYYPQGSLHNKALDPTMLKDAIRQILKALHHLHERGYIHRDIKPANVLISNLEGEPLNLVVADYGLTTWKKPVTFCGTLGYMAPEIVRNGVVGSGSKKSEYSNNVDIYALGILILEMLGITIPDHGIKNHRAFTGQIREPIAKAYDEWQKHQPERIDLLNVADRMLQYDPLIRPSVDECLQLPCLSREAPTPAAIQWPSPTSTIKSVASAPVHREKKREWSGIWAGDRYKRPGEQKRRRPLSPVLTTHKVKKRQHHHLPTPEGTPQKKRKARNSEEDEPEDAEDAEMAIDAPQIT